jgi:hypothetical protein
LDFGAYFTENNLTQQRWLNAANETLKGQQFFPDIRYLIHIYLAKLEVIHLPAWSVPNPEQIVVSARR